MGDGMPQMTPEGQVLSYNQQKVMNSTQRFSPQHAGGDPQMSKYFKNTQNNTQEQLSFLNVSSPISKQQMQQQKRNASKGASH